MKINFKFKCSCCQFVTPYNSLILFSCKEDTRNPPKCLEATFTIAVLCQGLSGIGFDNFHSVDNDPGCSQISFKVKVCN